MPAGVCGLSDGRRGAPARTVRARRKVLDAACGSRSRWSLRALRACVLPRRTTERRESGSRKDCHVLPPLFAWFRSAVKFLKAVGKAGCHCGLRSPRAPRSQGRCTLFLSAQTAACQRCVLPSAGAKFHSGGRRRGEAQEDPGKDCGEACGSSLEAPGHGKPGEENAVSVRLAIGREHWQSTALPRKTWRPSFA